MLSNMHSDDKSEIKLIYIKYQPKTIDLSTRLWELTRVCGASSPDPRAERYCVRLIFNISK